MNRRSGEKKFLETRSYPRYNYLSDLSIAYEGYGGHVPLHTPDLSVQGMFIHTSLEMPQGAVVKVRFRLQRMDFEVEARGEVRYCLPGVGVGVEFVDISPQAQQAIAEELGIRDQEDRDGSPEPEG